MPVVKPPVARHTVEDLGDSLKIIIPVYRQWFKILVLCFWFIMWAFGEVMVGGVLVSEGVSAGSLFLIAWLGFWTLGGTFVLYALFWQLTGKEVIEVSRLSIRVRRQVLGLGRTKEYLGEYVRGLRISPAQGDGFGWSRTLRFWGLSGGLIAFDYGAGTFRLGIGIDEAEARQILAAIGQRFPQYWGY